MGLPGEVPAFDPLADMQRRNQQVMSALEGDAPAHTPVGPPGLAPAAGSSVVTDDLPDYLLNPGSYVAAPAGPLAADGSASPALLTSHASQDTLTSPEANPDPAPESPDLEAVLGLSVGLFDVGLGLNLSQEKDGLFWKVACKSGILALSPGPGAVDVEQPLNLTAEMFGEIKTAFDEQAFPYVTVPQSHANHVLENTGYVRKLDVVDRDTALLDDRLSPEAKKLIALDPPNTSYLLCGVEFTEPEVAKKAENGSIADTSIGVKFGYRNKRTGKTYKAALEHLALTNIPWVDGLVPFGLSQGPYDHEREQGGYDRVYVQPSKLDLAIKARVTSDDSDYDYDLDEIDPKQIRADAGKVLALTDGVELPLGVCVKQFDGQYVVQSGYDKIVAIRPDASAALDAAMDALKARYEDEREERTKYAVPSPTKQLPPWPEDDGDEPDDDGTDGDTDDDAEPDNDPDDAVAKKKKLALSQRLGFDLSARTAGDTLPRERATGTLRSKQTPEIRVSKEQDNHMSRTVEEILAQQQAEAEASAARIQELEQKLALSQERQEQTANELHRENVSKRVRALQAEGVSPAVLVKAKEILLADKPSTAEGGLNLSVQSGDQTVEFKRPAEIVEYLLSAMPRDAAAAHAAQQVAAVRENLDDLSLSQADANTPEAKKQAVEAWERENHPERFNADGSRK